MNYRTYVRNDGWLVKVFHTYYVDAMGKRTAVTLECQSGDAPSQIGRLANKCGIWNAPGYTHGTQIECDGALWDVYDVIYINEKGKPQLVRVRANTPSQHALGCYADALIRFYREDQLKKAREENIRELKLI